MNRNSARRESTETAAGPAEKLFLYPWQGYVLPNAKLATAVRATDGSYMACELPGTVSYQAENAEVDQAGVFRVAANASAGPRFLVMMKMQRICSSCLRKRKHSLRIGIFTRSELII